MFNFDPTLTPRAGDRPIVPLRARALETPAEETAIDKADRVVKGVGAGITLFLLALIGVQAVRDRRGRR